MSGDGGFDWGLLRRFQTELDYLDLVRMELLNDAAASWQHASAFNNDWRSAQ